MPITKFNNEGQLTTQNSDDNINSPVFESDEVVASGGKDTALMPDDDNNELVDSTSNGVVTEEGDGPGSERIKGEATERTPVKKLGELTKKEIFGLFRKFSQEGQAEEEIRASLGLNLGQYNSLHKKLYDPESDLTEPKPTYKACSIKSLHKNIKWAAGKSFDAVPDERLIKIEAMTPDEFVDAYNDGCGRLVVLTLLPPAPSEWSVQELLEAVRTNN